jgi:hypothetical protein
VKSSLLHLTRAVAALLSAAVVGRYGMPVLATLGFLAVAGIGVTCWIVSSEDRSINLSRIMYARRGDRRYLDIGQPGLTPRRKRRSPARGARKTPGQLPPAKP